MIIGYIEVNFSTSGGVCPKLVLYDYCNLQSNDRGRRATHSSTSIYPFCGKIASHIFRCDALPNRPNFNALQHTIVAMRNVACFKESSHAVSQWIHITASVGKFRKKRGRL